MESADRPREQVHAGVPVGFVEEESSARDPKREMLVEQFLDFIQQWCKTCKVSPPTAVFSGPLIWDTGKCEERPQPVLVTSSARPRSRATPSVISAPFREQDGNQTQPLSRQEA